MHFWQILKFGSILLTMLACAACEPKIAERGHSDLATKQKKIEVGQTTQQQVIDLMGSPSSVSQFGDENWYYIGFTEKTYGFLRPEITKQDVVQLSFNDAGVVSGIKNYTHKDAKEFDVSERETPTSGSEYGFFEQLVGNIGKFNKQRDPLAAAQGRR